MPISEMAYDPNLSLSQNLALGNITYEEWEERGGTSGDLDGNSVAGGQQRDISGTPFEFNPPLHNANFHRRIDFASEDQPTFDTQYQQRDYVKGVSLSQMTSLRLGRITMGDKSENGLFQGDKRWGFRFLFNPTSWQGSQEFSNQINTDFTSEVPLFIAVGLEIITFTLLLDRVPDLGEGTTTGDYRPSISQDQLDEIRKRGTNYDLEYLFRVANVQVVTTKDGQTTGDFGILLPNLCVLHLGNMKFQGRMQSIQTQHVMFSSQAVPIRSTVNIAFQRAATLNQEDFDRLNEGGIETDKDRRRGNFADEGSGSDAGGGSGSGSAAGVETDFDTTGGTYGGLDAEQSDIASHIVIVAMNNFGANGPKAALIGLITAYQESKLRNLDYGDRDSVGVFQQRTSTGWGTLSQLQDVQYSVSAFFGVPPAGKVGTGGLSSVNGWPSMDPVEASHQVQRSAYPEAPRKWIPSMTNIRDEILQDLS